MSDAAYVVVKRIVLDDEGKAVAVVIKDGDREQILVLDAEEDES